MPGRQKIWLNKLLLTVFYLFVTVYSYIPVGFFLSRMKICLQECRSGAPRIGALRLADATNEQMRLTDAFEAAESQEVAVKPSSEGFANGAE